MTAHPKIGQVNQSDLGVFRELSGLVRVDLSVTDLPELHWPSAGVATLAVFCLICPFLEPVPPYALLGRVRTCALVEFSGIPW